MKQILITSTNFPPDHSGAGLRAMRLAKRMNKKYGYSYNFICPYRSAIKQFSHPLPYIKRLNLPGEEGMFFPLHIVMSLFKGCSYLLKNSRKIDIIHFFLFSWTARMMMLSNILFHKKKTIVEVTLDGIDDPQSLMNYGIKNRLFKPLTRYLLNKVDLFIVGSKKGLDSCLRAGIDSQKVLIKPRPCDEDVFGRIDFKEKQGLRKKLNLPDDKFIMLNVGRLSERKNQFFLIKCLELLDNKDIMLVLIGPYNKWKQSYFNRLQQYISKRGLEDQVMFAGEKNNINEYMITADLLAFASKREGFPNVIPESMLSGLPVVSLYLDCISPFINNEVGAIVRNTSIWKNLEEFTKTINKIYKKELTFDHDRIREYGLQYFSAGKIDAEYHKAYQELLGDKK